MSFTPHTPSKRTESHRHAISPTHLGSIPLAKRGVDCGQTNHACLDVQHPDVCCDNQSYCYVNAQNEPRCCPIGSNCVGDSPCNSEAYYCTITTALSFSGSSNLPSTTQQGCCGRRCPRTSYFLCPPDLGGKCCPYGAQCQSGGNCLQTIATSSTHKQETDDECTASDTHKDCQATSTNESSTSQDHELSAGVGAGIGVGVAVGACFFVAAVVWFVILPRRRRRRDLKGGVQNRAELVGSEAPPNRMPITTGESRGTGRGPGPGGAATEASTEISSLGMTTPRPLEMGSEEARSPRTPRSATRERLYSPSELSRVDSLEGVFELDGMEIRAPERPPPPVPSEENPLDKKGKS